MGDSGEDGPAPSETGGGPVKSFLEHLEDLRWLIIKIAAAILVALIVALYTTPQIVWILKRPLKQAALVRTDALQRALVQFDTNTLTTLTLSTNKFGPLDLGTNRFAVIQLEPVQIGTNTVLALRVDPNPSEEVISTSATDLVYLDPASPFMSSLHLAFYGGLLMSSPLIAFYLAQFILPALKFKEKKYIFRACFIGLGLFLAGISFCYFYVLARALKFAEVFAHWMGVKAPEWRAETYFSFVTKFMIGMGLGFELPVVLLALVKIGVLDYQKLSGMRRYMIVVNLVLGALLTTPEVFTQVVMAVILQILYEISVWIAWWWERNDRKQAALDDAAG